MEAREAKRAANRRVLRRLRLQPRRRHCDVATIDIDDAVTRFANKHGNVSARSLSVYGSRIRSAIKMFTDAKANPAGWKPPSSKARGSNGNGKTPTDKGRPKKALATHESRNSESTSHEEIAGVLGRGLSYPFPLRSDVTITISNIPRDLRAPEVDRIAQFLKALAIGDHKS